MSNRIKWVQAEIWMARELDCEFVLMLPSVIKPNTYTIQVSVFSGRDVSMEIQVNPTNSVRQVTDMINRELQEHRP